MQPVRQGAYMVSCADRILGQAENLLHHTGIYFCLRLLQIRHLDKTSQLLPQKSLKEKGVLHPLGAVKRKHLFQVLCRSVMFIHGVAAIKKIHAVYLGNIHMKVKLLHAGVAPVIV